MEQTTASAAAASTGADVLTATNSSVTIPAAMPESKEPAPPAAAAEAPPQESNSPKFEALARREIQARRLARQVKQKELELEQREARLREFEESQKKPKPTNPEEWLKQGGFTYDQLVEWKLNGNKVTPEMEAQALRNEFNSLKQEQEEKEKKAKETELERQKREYDETIQGFKEDINEFVTRHPDDYEYTLLYNAEHLVFGTIQEHWNKSIAEYNQALEDGVTATKPRMLTKKEAADLVEKYLEDLEAKAHNTKKWQSRYGGTQPQKPQNPEAKPQAAGSTPSKTLNNSMGAGPNMSTSFTGSKAEEDAFKRALAKLG